MTEISLAYPAKITFSRSDKVFHVTFRDIKHCFTYGETRTEAINNAEDVLTVMLQDMAKDEEHLPKSSKPRKGEILLSPYPEVAAPLELYILRKRSKKTIQEVANVLGVSKQRYSDLEKGKNLTLKTLHKAALALGASVNISLAA